MNDSEQYIPLLQTSFDKYYKAPREVWEEYARYCMIVYFKKEEIIKEQHTTERYFYFIIEGSVVLFLWKVNNFVCLDFAFEANFCSDYMSLLTNQHFVCSILVLDINSTISLLLLHGFFSCFIAEFSSISDL